MSPDAEPRAKRSQPNDEEKALMRRRLDAYEHDHDIVPGTASWDGWTPEQLGVPKGGTTWEGAARMALARLPEDRNDQDRDAIRRYPAPCSGVTGR